MEAESPTEAATEFFYDQHGRILIRSSDAAVVAFAQAVQSLLESDEGPREPTTLDLLIEYAQRLGLERRVIVYPECPACGSRNETCEASCRTWGGVAPNLRVTHEGRARRRRDAHGAHAFDLCLPDVCACSCAACRTAPQE